MDCKELLEMEGCGCSVEEIGTRKDFMLGIRIVHLRLIDVATWLVCSLLHFVFAFGSTLLEARSDDPIQSSSWHYLRLHSMRAPAKRVHVRYLYIYI